MKKIPLFVGRYASVLFDEGAKAGRVARFRESIEGLADALRADEELTEFLDSPAVPAASKRAFFERLFPDKEDIPLKVVLELVSRRSGIEFMPVLVERLRFLDENARGIARFSLETAFPLDPEFEALSLKIAEGMIPGKKVEMDIVQEKKLCGGFRLQADDAVVDLSVRARVEKMRERLRAGLGGK